MTPPPPCLGRRRCRLPPRPPLFVLRIARSRWVPMGHPYMAHSHYPNWIRKTGAAAPLLCLLRCRRYGPPVWRHWRDHPPLEKTYRGTPVGSLLISVCRCVPVVTHNKPVAVRRNTLSVVVFLPKKDKSVPRCLAGGDGGCVIPQPRDAETSSCPPVLRDVPQRLRDEQLLCCDNAGRLRDGGVGGVVGSG